ncbi:tyrosine-type recombinase/integrase [Leeia oryzae]|uniref:tyrosine-type recombinase/integrase n=1 Tax=Leeia oryzae TaxID=356662 RepID=UPI00035C6EB9|nr:site-specific integrase [Leeia oryzae]
MKAKKNPGWLVDLLLTIKPFVRYRADGKFGADLTKNGRIDSLKLIFSILQEKGYRVRPANIREKHIQIICDTFLEKNYALSTIQTHLSALRQFAKWIEKPGLVRSTSSYFSDKAIFPKQSKPKASNPRKTVDIDVEAVLNKIQIIDKYCYMQVRMVLEFGLTVYEAISFRPNEYSKIDDGYIEVFKNVKNRQKRIVKITNEEQSILLKYLMDYSKGNNDHISHQLKTSSQCASRMNTVLKKVGLTKKKLGITLHELCIQYSSRKSEDESEINDAVKNLTNLNEDKLVTSIIDKKTAQLENVNSLIAVNKFVWIQSLLIHAFGLSVRQVVNLHPQNNIHSSGVYFFVKDLDSDCLIRFNVDTEYKKGVYDLALIIANTNHGSIRNIRYGTLNAILHLRSACMKSGVNLQLLRCLEKNQKIQRNFRYVPVWKYGKRLVSQRTSCVLPSGMLKEEAMVVVTDGNLS